MVLNSILIMAAITAFIAYHLIRYRNPYKLYMVFGKKGSGKSTLMVKLAIKYRKKGFNVYCNTLIPGTYYIDTEDIGLVDIPPNSVLMIDEVGMIWDNRDFKNFKNYIRDYFKLQRHYRHVVYLFSQSFDIDKKLRDLTDHMYLIGNLFNCLSVARRITKTITITEANKTQAGESKLVDQLKFDSLLLFWCGSLKLTYIPRYVKYFDSFEAPALKPKTFEYTEIKKFPPFYKRAWQALRGYARRVQASIKKFFKR